MAAILLIAVFNSETNDSVPYHWTDQKNYQDEIIKLRLKMTI